MRIWSIIQDGVVIADFLDESEALEEAKRLGQCEVVWDDYRIFRTTEELSRTGYASDPYFQDGRLVIDYDTVEGDLLTSFMVTDDHWF